jgi:AhpD family alkylhydroperoxidase
MNMAYVQPLARDSVASLDPIFAAAEQSMGFVPNSMLTMAHMPQLPVGFMMLVNCIFGGDLKRAIADMAEAVPDHDGSAPGISQELMRLVAFAASVSAGCRYCQAHTSHQAHGLGVTAEKYEQILSYETSDAFSDPERAAIALAFAAAAVPNEAAPEHFNTLRQHFSEQQIVQIVAVISLFGFLNRWNDTMATQLEQPAVDFAAGALDGVGWHLGKHGA